MVHNDMSPPEGVSGDVPFSWRIKDYLEELWVQAQYITGAEGEPGDAVTRGVCCHAPRHSRSEASGWLGHPHSGGGSGGAFPDSASDTLLSHEAPCSAVAALAA